MYTLNANTAALSAQNTSRMQADDLNESLRRLSSGLRINSASDDVGGIVVANNIRAQESSTGEALKNVNKAIGMFQIMDKAIDQQLKILDTVKAKAIQAATDGQSQQIRDALQNEVAELLKELDNISRTTSYNGTKLLDGSFVNTKIQVGAFANDLLEFSINSSETDKIGHVSYQTTYGGSRNIDGLALKFKNAGHGGEDISIAPFNLSHTAGKSVKDLAAFVNKHTETTGVRAVYREGEPPLSHELNALSREPDVKSVFNSDKSSVDVKKITVPTLNTLETSKPVFNNNTQKDIGINTNANVYPISFRALVPEVSFPRSRKIYEDVAIDGAFNHSSVIIKVRDDEISTSFSNNQIRASIDGKPISAKFDRIDDTSIEMTIPTPLPSSVVTDTTVPKKVDLVFDSNVLVSGSQLEPSSVLLEYGRNPTSKLQVIGSLIETATAGEVSGKITLELHGDTFDTSLPIANVGTFTPPAGLTINSQNVKYLDNRRVEYDISASGATPHGAVDDLSLDLSAFSNNAVTSTILPSNSTTVKIVADLLDQPTVSFDSTIFKESTDNNGYISTSVVMKVDGDKFNKDLTSAQIANMIDLTTGGNPLGTTYPDLQVEYNVKNDNELTVTFRKQAQVNNVDISAMNLTFNANSSSLFEHKLIPATSTIALNGVDFISAPSFTITPTTGFLENSLNDGSFPNSVLLTIPTGAGANTFSADVTNQIDVVDLPAGLTADYTRVSDSEVSVRLNGKAINHSIASVPNFGFGFRKDAFSDPVNAFAQVDFKFVNLARATVSGVFSESLATNDGTISNPITIALDSSFNGTVSNGDDVTSFFNTQNIPNGLNAEYTIIDTANRTVEMKLNGKATSHDDDILNMTFVANGGLFESNVDSARSLPLSINFLPSIDTKVSGFLKESLANDGTVGSRLTIEIQNDIFNATVNDTLLNSATTPVTIPSLPSGLDPSYHKIDDTHLEISFNGAASNHYSYDVDSILSVNFNSSMFRASNTNVVAKAKAEFIDPTPIVSVAYGSFIESSSNDGAITSEVALKIPSGVTLKDSVKQEFVDDPVAATRKYIKSYDLPYVLTPLVSVDLNFPDLIKVNLSDKALSHGSEDSSKFKIRLSPSMFNNNNVVSDVDLDLTFYDKPGLSVFGSFREGEFNDGFVDGEVNISVLGTTLKNVNVENFITATNIPDGLVPKFTKVNNSILMKLEGNAHNHTEFDDVHNISLAFNNALFENGMNVNDIRNIGVDFKDALKIKVTDSFVESDLNDGSITTSIILKGENDLLVDGLTTPLEDLITVSKLPLGLTPTYEALSKREIKMSLKGKAFLHDIDSSSNISISLDKGIFQSGIKADDIEDISIHFKGAPVISSQGSFEETFLDDGSIQGALTFSIQNDVFKSVSDLSQNIITYNLPTGLTPKYELIDDTHMKMTLEGKAFNSANSNDVDNLSIQFTGKSVGKGVEPRELLSDLSIDFKDSPKIYASDFFRESSSNDGSIGNSIDLTVYGDRFSSVNPNDFIEVDNLPKGLQAFFTRESNSKINMRLLGSAIDGTSANDVTSLIIKYKPELFENKVASVNTEKIYVDFKDRPSVKLVGSMLENSFNDGSFSDSMIIQLNGDIMKDVSEAELNKLVNLSNLPAGLTPVFKKINDIELNLSFTGKAKIHDKVPISPVLNMDNALFKNELSPLPIELNNIKFINNPNIIVENTFIESIKNDGSVDNSISIVVEGDAFADIDLNKSIIASNVPVGLTPVFIKKNQSLVEMTLDGKALEHDNRFDTKDIKIDFAKDVFKSGINAKALTGVGLNFREKPNLSTRSFVESDLNDGSIKKAVTLTITEDSDAFLDTDLNSLIEVKNLPIGLTPKFVRLDDKNVKMTLDGKAFKHSDAEDVSNVSLKFNSGAFLSGLQAADIINMVVDFRDPLVPIFEAKESIFKEGSANDGSIGNTIDLKLKGEDKIATGITDLNIGQYIKVDPKNIPSGLTPKFKVVTDTLVQMSFTGKASAHLNKNDTPLKLTFDKDLFERKVAGKDLNDLSIDFDDPLIVFEGNFKESAENDGSTTSKVLINLFGDEYADVDYSKFIDVDKLPLGLTPKYVKKNNSQLEMTLQGRAIEHGNDFDVDNLGIKLQKETTKSQEIAYKPNQKTGLDFDDPSPAIQKAGGPGLYGGYITFISENAREVVISAGANQSKFGLDNQFRTTMNLKEVLLTKFDASELYATGIEKDPNVTTKKDTTISGLSNKHSALITMDAVDSAAKYLRNLRGKIASLQGRMQLASDRLLIERQNLKSAESSIRDIDFAEETTLFQKRSLLAQAGNYMLSQANVSQKMVLDLLKF